MLDKVYCELNSSPHFSGLFCLKRSQALNAYKSMISTLQSNADYEKFISRKCGNMGSFSIHLIGKVIAVKVASEPFNILQGNKLNGFYRVGEIL